MRTPLDAATAGLTGRSGRLHQTAAFKQGLDSGQPPSEGDIKVIRLPQPAHREDIVFQRLRDGRIEGVAGLLEGCERQSPSLPSVRPIWR